MRNEELGINTFAPLGRVLFCASLPRAVPTADGVCPFNVLVGAQRGEWECVGLGYLRIENDYTRGGAIANPTEQGTLTKFYILYVFYSTN